MTAILPASADVPNHLICITTTITNNSATTCSGMTSNDDTTCPKKICKKYDLTAGSCVATDNKMASCRSRRNTVLPVVQTIGACVLVHEDMIEGGIAYPVFYCSCTWPNKGTTILRRYVDCQGGVTGPASPGGPYPIIPSPVPAP